MSYLTDDFTETSNAGVVVDREQERKVYAADLNKIKSMESHFSLKSFCACPDGAYCDLTIHSDGIGYKKVLFMKLQGPFTNDLVVHDLWVNTADGPRLKSRLTLVNQLKLGG